jgi:hypothetical protein
MREGCGATSSLSSQRGTANSVLGEVHGCKGVGHVCNREEGREHKVWRLGQLAVMVSRLRVKHVRQSRRQSRPRARMRDARAGRVPRPHVRLPIIACRTSENGEQGAEKSCLIAGPLWPEALAVSDLRLRTRMTQVRLSDCPSQEDVFYVQRASCAGFSGSTVPSHRSLSCYAKFNPQIR